MGWGRRIQIQDKFLRIAKTQILSRNPVYLSAESVFLRVFGDFEILELDVRQEDRTGCKLIRTGYKLS